MTEISVSVIYDLSRLITRVLNPTPNGIDRIDWLLARHYLTHRQFKTIALAIGFAGPRLMPHMISLGATDRVAAAWNETSTKGHSSSAYREIVARLCAKHESGRRLGRIVESRPKRIANVAQALFRYVPGSGPAPQRAAPRKSIYMNVANFPLDWDRHIAWLDQRPDIRPVFFIHDLLPIQQPQWFWPKEPSRHARRLALLARRGAAAIVASTSVEQDLRGHLALSGKANLPIFRTPPPVSEIFSEPATFDSRLAAVPFFVICGTIEPRKNHLLLLDVWRELVTIHGATAPKLVIVGNRGWNSEKTIHALEDEFLRGHVIEVAGLPTCDYKKLLDHCRALLAPSFAEGFGLPVAEALATGTPIIASAIPPFLEQDANCATYLDPVAKDDWRKAILSLAEGQPRSLAANITGKKKSSEAAYLSALDDFLQSL